MEEECIIHGNLQVFVDFREMKSSSPQDIFHSGMEQLKGRTKTS